MITLCHAAKGGSGTTVVACSRAIDTHGPTLLVDLAGDIPAMLGLAEPDRPGVFDWLTSEAPVAHLHDLLVTVTPACTLLPTRLGPAPSTPPDDGDRWDALADWLVEWAHDSGGSVVVDAGTVAIPDAFATKCPARWLVTRACYISLRRASRLAIRPTGVVLVDEPGHRLTARDIETSTGAPIVATMAWDPSVASAVDSGLLLSGRLPRVMRKAFSRVPA